MHALIHPVGYFVVFLALVALAFIIDQIGLWGWIAWLNRRQGKPKNEDVEEYWKVHQ